MFIQSGSVINTLNKSLTSESDEKVFDEFVERVQTFIDGQRWVKKPLALSPTICAQYGWKCVKPDLLECVTCGAKLYACEFKMGNFEAYKACLEKTLSDLKDNHGKHCPWPITSSPENFVKMVALPKEEALSQFVKRVEASLPFRDSLPKIKESVLLELDLTDHQIVSLCEVASVPSKEVAVVGKSLASLAASGWTLTEELESKKCFLKCNNCLRSVWCHLFSSCSQEDPLLTENASSSADAAEEIFASNCHDDVEENKENSEEPAAKKKKLSFKKGDPFDPLHEHRPWCLWIHSESNTSKEAPCNTPGWKTFTKSLVRNISDKQVLNFGSPSKEQIRSVKNMLEKWTDV